MNRRMLLVAIALIVFAGFAGAQDKQPNFTGMWKMNAEKSDFGPLPKPDKLDRVIAHKDNEIASKTTQSGQQGEATTDVKYKTDGSESVNTVRGQEVKSVAKWEGANLIVKTKRETQGMEISITETWSLAADGKTLTVANAIDTPQGQFALTIVLDKQ